MKYPVLLGIIAIFLMLSGCIGDIGASNFVKTLPEVQAFLDENPDADIRAVFIKKQDVGLFIGGIKEICGEQMEEAPYWHVYVTKGEQQLEVYLDESGQQALCIIKTVGGLQDECSAGTDCNDSNLCTTDTCTGSPKKCSNTQITACAGGDNCCPQGCTYTNDSDCPVATACANVTCSDEKKCVGGQCVEKTCAERGGENCDVNRICDGQTVASSDNSNCCLGNCVGIDCTEDWVCGAWSDCVDGIRTRDCADLHSCGTTVSKPPTTRNCGSLDCVADSGELASEGCDARCDECACTTSYNSGLKLASARDWEAYKCLYLKGGEDVDWVQLPILGCTENWYYLPDKDYLNNPCICGDYYCRYRSYDDPQTLRNPRYWDRCENKVCRESPKCGNDGECDDGDSCTIDRCGYGGLIGYCDHTEITECKSGLDGCCPAGCDYTTDEDCE